MERILVWLLENKEVSGGALVIIAGILVRIVKKRQLMKITGDICYNFFKTVSIAGNTRFGKKAMDSIEEGFFESIFAIFSNAIKRSKEGLAFDNKKDSNNNDKQTKK